MDPKKPKTLSILDGNTLMKQEFEPLRFSPDGSPPSEARSAPSPRGSYPLSGNCL